MLDRRKVWHALGVAKYQRYWSGAHTRHRLLYHMVWIPKYRKRVLLGKVAVRVKELLWEAAQVNRWWFHEVNVQRDHVHALVQLDPATSVAQENRGTSIIL